MLNRILYGLVVFPISRSPYWLLYFYSDLLNLILFRVFNYRSKVISGNLERSFPEKTDAEIRAIRKEFGRHFCDLIFESIKAFTITKEEANKRCTYANPEIMHELAAKGKSVVMIGGHYGNWELFAITIDGQIPQQARALYTPLSSAFWNEKMKKSRSKFGCRMIAINKARSLFKQKEKELSATVFAADQSPRNSNKAYWMNF